MTPDGFRKLALALPGASEKAHMGHPDFRVGGRIFATLGWPDGGWGMVSLTLDDQEVLVAACPAAFAPVRGGWGKRGATSVLLAKAPAGLVEDALRRAWRRRAPKRLRALENES